MTMRVFIIDDDEDHAESIADLLEFKGYSVEIAFSGEEGVARFRQQDFDVVLMDVRLPGMNGVETFFEFRKIRPHARVLMMTGFSVEALVAQAVDNGALGILYKPFAVEELLTTLERVKPRGLVLVADDDPEFAESIEPVLRQNGYAVEIARDGQSALEMASRPDVTCLILDLRMPLLSGLEVYLRLKEAGRLMPTILVTGFADEQDRARLRLDDFAAGLLQKPFDPAELLHALKTALARLPEQAHAK